jgi:outer membrane protein assembly factor BamE (lipoprotein component of BamABCDE complex)
MITISFMVVLASCAPITDTRGHNSEAIDLKQIVIGQSRTDDVIAILGSPTTRSNFGDETWYYVNQVKQTRGPFAPEVVDQQVIAVRFNSETTVSDVTEYKKEQGKLVEIVGKTTPSEGHSVTFMEQMLGNFGKFNSPGRGVSPRDLGR